MPAPKKGAGGSLHYGPNSRERRAQEQGRKEYPSRLSKEAGEASRSQLSKAIDRFLFGEKKR